MPDSHAAEEMPKPHICGNDNDPGNKDPQGDKHPRFRGEVPGMPGKGERQSQQFCDGKEQQDRPAADHGKAGDKDQAKDYGKEDERYDHRGERKAVKAGRCPGRLPDRAGAFRLFCLMDQERGPDLLCHVFGRAERCAEFLFGPPSGLPDGKMPGIFFHDLVEVLARDIPGEPVPEYVEVFFFSCHHVIHPPKAH